MDQEQKLISLLESIEKATRKQTAFARKSVRLIILLFSTRLSFFNSMIN